MELSGRVVKILPLVTGKGRNGDWKKQEFIMETGDKYPKQVCCSLWGDKVDEVKLAEGEVVNASIDIQSREHNGRWYTEIRAWKVERPSQRQQSSTPPPPDPDDGSDDLPF